MTLQAKIIVVDDEAGIRFFLEEVLTRDGHQVVAVESGEAALEHIAVEEFDLALLDLKLQGVDGIEVLTALRQQSPDTTIIVLTGYASLETAVDALRQGSHDYLFKPCKVVELRESVRTGLLKRQRALKRRELLAQLERSLFDDGAEGDFSPVPDLLAASLSDIPEQNVEQARFLRHKGVIVDVVRHVITLDGHLLELSPSEFDLLAYLVSESPRVVSSQELVREVQGYEIEQWEAREIIRYHIYRIRRKLKAATGRTDLIATVRGVGYRVSD